MARLSKDCEQAARRNDLQTAAALWAEILCEYERFREALRDLDPAAVS
jgi:iron uptake system EfeUOB component EfeO/EfeM